MLTSIDKNFDGSQVPALRGVSITTEAGEFVVVVGACWCGKSTLLYVAAGILKPLMVEPSRSITSQSMARARSEPWSFRIMDYSRG